METGGHKRLERFAKERNEHEPAWVRELSSSTSGADHDGLNLHIAPWKLVRRVSRFELQLLGSRSQASELGISEEEIS